MTDYVSRSALARPRVLEEGRVGAYLRGLDWLLLGAVAALVAYGLWVVTGVTRDDVVGNERYFVTRQAFAVGLGAVGLVAASLIDPGVYRRHKRVVFAVMIALLLVVVAIGTEVRGSQRWLDLGFYRFQPSEFSKLLLVIFLAAFLADRSKRIGETGTVAAAVGFAVVPTVLVFFQPDIGTALCYAAGLAAALFFAGARWLHLALLAAIGSFVVLFVLWFGPAAGLHILKPYQTARLTAFANPENDPGGAGYNVDQSITAVGAGGLGGRGVDDATQTNLDYLPEHATDFVFASLAEQRGFVGASILLLLYLLVIWRAIKIVAAARDAFSAIVAGAIAFMLLFQIFINVGMTIGLAPVTGIPLPFVSFGGSAMVMNLAAIGILQAIAVRSR
jgi:rod shape determining protein RodA